MSEQNTDVKSLAHTKWNCKYHVVFAPKYRRKVFFNEKKEAIREIIRTLCQWKGVEIIEGEICPDHSHLLLSIPPKMSVSGFMGYLKGKSSLMIFQRFGNMKFAYRNREFWCKGYYVDTVGKNTAAIRSYIANQSKIGKWTRLVYLIRETRLRVASNPARGWQANRERTCAWLVVLGLCLKMKNHPLCGWMFIRRRGRLYPERLDADLCGADGNCAVLHVLYDVLLLRLCPLLYKIQYGK